MKEDEDKILLETYMWGFNDELDNRVEMWNPNPLLLKAYKLGRQDALVGNDLKSFNCQTNQQILHRIRS
jgi:hypothetical protein